MLSRVSSLEVEIKRLTERLRAVEELLGLAQADETNGAAAARLTRMLDDRSRRRSATENVIDLARRR